MSVNGPSATGMYSMKSYYNSSEPVPMSDCMYGMKSIHQNQNENSKVVAPGDIDPVELAKLEERQEKILQRLSQLQTEVDKLSKEAPPKVAGSAAMISSSYSAEPFNGVIKDLVINANPSNPPYSLLVLHSLLCQQYKVLSACHTHSSALNVDDKLKSFFGQNGINRDRMGHQLAVTLIWKDVKNGPSLMVSPQRQTAIIGEANIARYLARLINPAYDSGDIVVATEIDSVLDLTPQLISGNNKEKSAALRTLNSKLGKSNFLVGKELSLADIVLWSAVQQSGQTAPGNVQKWLDSCNNNIIFQAAKQLLS